MHIVIKKPNILFKLASPKIIITSLLSFIIIMLLVNAVFKQNFGYLTQTFNYTPEYVYQLLNDIGSSGRIAHLLVLLPDILMVLLYTVLLLGANYAIFSRLTQNCLLISIITFSPLFLSIIQFVEIILLAIILLQYPIQMLSLAHVVNYVTMIKTVLTILFFLMPLVGICAIAIKRLKKQVCGSDR